MTSLDFSSWRSRARRPIGSFLKSIGVSYRKGKGFYLLNEDRLEYVFHDMCKRAREIKADLHPQNGGDSEIFAQFGAEFERAKRGFYKNGMREPDGAMRRLKEREDKLARDAARGEFRYHNKA